MFTIWRTAEVGVVMVVSMSAGPLKESAPAEEEEEESTSERSALKSRLSSMSLDRDEEEKGGNGLDRRRKAAAGKGDGRGEPGGSRDAASAVSVEERFHDGTRDADTM